MNKKKLYFAPDTEIVDVKLESALLCESIPLDDNGTQGGLVVPTDD